MTPIYTDMDPTSREWAARAGNPRPPDKKLLAPLTKPEYF